MPATTGTPATGVGKPPVAAPKRRVPRVSSSSSSSSSSSPPSAVRGARGDGAPADPLAKHVAAIERFGTPFAVASSSARYSLEPGVAPDGGTLYCSFGGWVPKGSRGAAVDYARLCARWPKVEDDELYRCARRVNRCERLAANELVVRWETVFVPAKLRWLHDIGEAIVEGLDRLDYTVHAATFTSTVDISAYQTRVDGGWWQGEYYLGVSPWHSSLSHRGDFSGMTSAEFLERYNSRYGEKPSYHGPAAFSAACALAAAVEQVASLDPSDVAASLRTLELQEFGFYSPMNFGDENGQNRPEIIGLFSLAANSDCFDRTVFLNHVHNVN